MEKYTVDLDKVLNDFEYSELTEQSDIQHVNSYASSSSGELRHKNSSAKHSINNVFNSLNEYLNTEIVDRKKDNNFTENNLNLNDLDLDKRKGDFKRSVVPDNLSLLNEITPKICIESHNVVKCIEKEVELVKSVGNVAKHVTHEADLVKRLGNEAGMKHLGNEVAESSQGFINLTEETKNQIPHTNNSLKQISYDDIYENQILNNSRENVTEKIPKFEQAVGFNTNLEIDEDELNNYLENLEIEMDGIPNVPMKNENLKIHTQQLNKFNEIVAVESVEEAEKCLKSVEEAGKHLKNMEEASDHSDKVQEAEKLLKHVKEAGKSLENVEEVVKLFEDVNADKLKNLEEAKKHLEKVDEVGKYVLEAEKHLKTLEEAENLDQVARSMLEEETLIADEKKFTRGEEKFILVNNEKQMKKIKLQVNNVEEKAYNNTRTENCELKNLPKVLNNESNNYVKHCTDNGAEASLSEACNDINVLNNQTKNETENFKICKTGDIVAGNETHLDVNKINKEEEQLHNNAKTNNYESKNVHKVLKNDNLVKPCIEKEACAASNEKFMENDANVLKCDPKLLKNVHENVSIKNKNGDKNSKKIPTMISSAENEETGASNVEDLNVKNEEVVASLENQSERPSSLNITNKEAKREINLIGNPGSTPYNNLYVTKEISHDKSKANYESESSTSVSPTFSEASTDSVHSSTISTDLENETLKPTTPEEMQSIEEAVDEISEESAEASNSTQISQNVQENLDGIYAAGDNIDPELENVANTSEKDSWIGKRAPIWIADADALFCLHCSIRFTMIRRRHHCRACGLVLCSKCCNMKHRLEYLDMEARVCTECHKILSQNGISSSASDESPAMGNSPNRQAGQPNPNNPMEYCSVVPPLQQVSTSGDAPPTVMVPVGVLKRKGSSKTKHNKSVMFCDGIRPGSDLTNLDNDFNYNETKSTSSTSSKKAPPSVIPKANKNIPHIDSNTNSFIPENENCLPPTVTTFKSDVTYTDCANNANVVEMLKNETLTFALQRNLHVHVRLINMDCCINKQAWCFTTEGLISVGQDEIVILLEYIDNEMVVPKDIFHNLNNIFNSALKGTTITELGFSMHPTTNFLDSKNHAGFIYIRPTFQCLQNVIIPKEPYLIGILVHRWETPWAKIFPLRLVLRLGAEYRYYPSPIISTRHRDSVFVEIGHTIINLLADFRNFSYTLPNIRGLSIHMEEKNTTVTIPVNRYDQVIKSIINSSDHILAFGGNFSTTADSHLVCIQDTHGNNENSYTTHAINIQNKPRKVTGASFIVFNGALKSSSGLTAKSSIVEDGLMIQIPAEHMLEVRKSLRSMKNHTIQCGCVNATSDETVSIVWGEADTNFNVGVKSSVDDKVLSGVPSIRVHNGKDFICNSGNRLIRWTEVFLLQNGEENPRTQDPVDISKIAESISKATCQALVKYLDLLATNNFYKIGIRTTLHVENVSYSAGSNGIKLPPIYMKSLDNELIPVLHRITSNNLGDNAIVLELIFRILNV